MYEGGENIGYYMMREPMVPRVDGYGSAVSIMQNGVPKQQNEIRYRVAED